MTNIAVIGAGSWGTTLANLLGEKGYPLNLWVHTKNVQRDIAEKRENRIYLPGIKISPLVSPLCGLTEAVKEKKIIVLATPSHLLRKVAEKIIPFISRKAIIISASKGIENESLLTMSEMLRSILPPHLQKRLAVLSGPTFAREVAQKLPAAMVIASRDKPTLGYLQKLFSTPYLKVFTNEDILGVEIGGALKNVIALAAGICDGLRLGYNARAALLTRGIAEITRLGIARGARQETFSGLSGLGDLILTATGDLSRNRRVGIELAQGKEITEIEQEMQMVAEGIKTAKSAFLLCQKLEIRAAIIEEVYYIIYKKKPVRQAFTDLMEREIGEE